MGDFDKVQAMYWWLANHHEGQVSVKFRQLCRLMEIYRPGQMETGPDCEESISHYNKMCDDEGCAHDRLVHGETTKHSRKQG